MTKDFRELTSRLAKGLNFGGGTAVLITSEQDSDEVKVFVKGLVPDVMIGIRDVLTRLLQDADDHDARIIRDGIKNVLIEDEERRFQRKDVE